MKKTLSVILASALVLMLLASCNSNGKSGSTATSGAGSTAPQTSGSASTAAPAGDGETYTLSFSFYGPESNPPAQFCIEAAEKMKELSDGRLTMETYFNGTLLSHPDTISGVMNGTADVVLASSSVVDEVFPLNSVYSLPFIETPPGKHATDKAFLQLLTECPELQEELNASGVHWVTLASANGFQLHGTKTVFDSPATIPGKSIEGQGMGGAIVNAWGGSGTTLPVSDIYMSLSNGMLDGVLQHFGFLEAFALKEVVTTHTVFSNVTDPTDYEAMMGGGVYASVIGIIVNNESIDALPEDLQKIFTDVMVEFPEYISYADINVTGKAALDSCIERGDEFVFVTDAERAPWVEPLKPLIDEYVAAVEVAGYDGQAVYDKLQELFKENA